MTVYFCNRGELDLATITTMGVSVKVSSSPIGFFGTGLKFALATLLRTGHEIEVWVAGERHTVTSETTQIRGEDFQVVCLDGERLGYTTSLGRLWEPWQAYRELSSNARDEAEWLVTDREVDPQHHDTCIRVSGDGIDTAHRARDTIFCASRIIFQLPGMAEVREGASESVFYRGVRVHTLKSPTRHTWNILKHIELTEDRTMRWPWELESIMGRTISQCDRLDLVLDAVVSSDHRTPEAQADYSLAERPSETFMEAMRLRGASAGVSDSARRLWTAHASSEEVYRVCELDEEESGMLVEAMDLCLLADPDFQSEPTVVADLGTGVLGTVRVGRVFIARGCFTMGLETLAATLYEEYCHQHLNLSDGREMQDWFLRQLFRTVARL